MTVADYFMCLFFHFYFRLHETHNFQSTLEKGGHHQSIALCGAKVRIMTDFAQDWSDRLHGPLEATIIIVVHILQYTNVYNIALDCVVLFAEVLAWHPICGWIIITTIHDVHFLYVSSVATRTLFCRSISIDFWSNHDSSSLDLKGAISCY